MTVNTVHLALRPEQSEILRQGLLWQGPPLVWSSPTGSGKTWMARFGLRHALDGGQRAALLVPLRALANEVAARLREDPLFADVAIARLTGELAEDDGAPGVSAAEGRLWVATYEKLDSLLRRPGSHFSLLAELGTVIIDEAHLLGEGRRGAVLEGALVRLRALNPMAQVVLLSATLGNGAELAEWLRGRFHETHERPVPLRWERRTFRRAADKLPLAAQACAEIAGEGGQALVFVQSRARAEEWARALREEHGLRAGHHHAGLTARERERVETAFRGGALQVLCATPTLAAGVNVPARLVVLADCQRYVGAGQYTDISVVEAWQRAGRAGRPGLDAEGRALVLQPSWVRRQTDYLAGAFEPIRSALGERRLASEQVLVAVSAGFARTAEQVGRLLAHTLAARQGRLPALPPLIETMVAAGMLARDEDGALYATRAGHIACAHMLAPEGVQALARFVAEVTEPTVFDVLLVCAALPGSDFSVWAPREDGAGLAEALTRHPSVLAAREGLLGELGLVGKRRADALVRAAVLMAWAGRGDAQAAGALAGYSESDTLALRQEVLRVLQAAAALVARAQHPCAARQIALAYAMVASGLDGEPAKLALIPGIGPVLARRLVATGIGDLAALAEAPGERIAAIPGVSLERALQWRFAAQALLDHEAWAGGEGAPAAGAGLWDGDLGLAGSAEDYRARRARELRVAAEEDGSWTVSGGSEPHRVMWEAQGWRCDCADFAAGHLCKHVLAVGSRHHQHDAGPCTRAGTAETTTDGGSP